RGEAPLNDAGAALDVARDQLAGLLGQVEHHRGRLGHHEAVVVDDRHLAKGADAPVGLAVKLTAGMVERVDSIRQPGLLERPLRPKVLRLADPLGEDTSEAIKRDHVVSSISRRRRSRCARSSGVSSASRSPGSKIGGMSSSVGVTPASLFFVASTMTMTARL